VKKRGVTERTCCVAAKAHRKADIVQIQALLILFRSEPLAVIQKKPRSIAVEPEHALLRRLIPATEGEVFVIPLFVCLCVCPFVVGVFPFNNLLKSQFLSK
jgi:hypothetical protein